MSQVTPEGFANYPRPSTGPDPEKLRLLADGYFGLNIVFGINVVMVLASNGFLKTIGTTSGGATTLFGILGLFFVVVASLTYPQNKKIGQGLGWQPSGAIIASILMGLNSALCCGTVGYLAMKSFAAKKFAEAGLPSGSFFGYRKPHVYSFINSLSNKPPLGQV